MGAVAGLLASELPPKPETSGATLKDQVRGRGRGFGLGFGLGQG